MVRVVLTYGPTSPRLRADLSSLTGRLVSVRVVRGPSCLAPDSPCHFENQGKMGEVVKILGCAHFKENPRSTNSEIHRGLSSINKKIYKYLTLFRNNVSHCIIVLMWAWHVLPRPFLQHMTSLQVQLTRFISLQLIVCVELELVYKNEM
jgi:hypothetical protein